MKKYMVLVAVALLAFGSIANADTITLSTAGIVGVSDLNGVNDNSNPETRVVYANILLGMTANDFDTVNGIDYRTGPTDYTGSVTQADTVLGTNIVPIWAGYVLAKYDGPQAGYVMFYMPDWGTGQVPLTIPANAGFATWETPAPHEYGLSGYTIYTSVPDGGSLSMLLGMALMGLAGARRMMK